MHKRRPTTERQIIKRTRQTHINESRSNAQRREGACGRRQGEAPRCFTAVYIFQTASLINPPGGGSSWRARVHVRDCERDANVSMQESQNMTSTHGRETEASDSRRRVCHILCALQVVTGGGRLGKVG